MLGTPSRASLWGPHSVSRHISAVTTTTCCRFAHHGSCQSPCLFPANCYRRYARLRRQLLRVPISSERRMILDSCFYQLLRGRFANAGSSFSLHCVPVRPLRLPTKKFGGIPSLAFYNSYSREAHTSPFILDLRGMSEGMIMEKVVENCHGAPESASHLAVNEISDCCRDIAVTSTEKIVIFGEFDASTTFPEPKEDIGSLEGGFEAQLKLLDDSNQIATLAIVDLHKILEMIGRPIVGCKQELVQEVQNYISSMKASGQTACEKNQKQAQIDLLTGKVFEADTKKVQPVCRIYTRRRHRGSKVIIQDSLKETSGISKSELQVENSAKESLAFCNSKASSVQNIVACIEEQLGPDSVTFPKKRRLVVKGPRPPEPEVIADMGSNLLLNEEEPWTRLTHKKIQPGWFAYNPAKMRPAPSTRGMNTMKLLSWNVNGLRALLKGKAEHPFVQLQCREPFDVLCLQETKLQEKDVGQIKLSHFSSYESSFWNCSVTKLGYSGTAVLSRRKPLSVRYGLGNVNHDSEGRLITLEFDSFCLVAGYVPNSGQKLERLAYRTQEWDISLSDYVKDLEKIKPVILTGDLNCAHQEIDIYNPEGNRRSAGFTDEERNSFEANFLNKGLVDSFRRQHPNAVGYTYWGYRSGARPTNKGWRLDYFLVSDSMADHVSDSFTLPDVRGSDHCPIGLVLEV